MLIVDAGPLVAAAITDDRHHAACTDLLASATPPLVVPVLVISEVGHLLAARLGPAAEARFSESLADGDLEVEAVRPDEWPRVHELVERYVDIGLGITDASVVVLAERLGQDTIASLDHRHLGVVAPAHIERLTLVPR